MKVTDIKIRKINNLGKMKAVVSLTFNDAFVVHDIKIIEGSTGLFVAMPSRKVHDTDYRDIAHPINKEARAALQKVIFESYEKALLSEEDEVRFEGLSTEIL